MSKYSVYIYPNISRELMGSNNPYIDHLKKALDENALEVDQTSSGNAFTDFLRKGIFSDMVILNWLENIPARRLGSLQTLILLSYIQLLKICRIKIVWIKHNKVSHTKQGWALSKKIQRFLARHADHIIIHALDAGITDPQKTLLIPHPSNIGPEDILPPIQGVVPSIDLLIWGSLVPYKGVLEFLQFAKNDPAFRGLRIHIAGKAPEAYWQQLKEQTGSLKEQTGSLTELTGPLKEDNGPTGPRITMVNEYVSEEALRELFRQSRFILFTYNKRSVISSGALMDSLVACKRIIAPDCGAFRDLADHHQFVSLFDDFSAIVPLCRENYDNFNLNYQEVYEFVAQNSWYNMGSKIKGLTGLKTAVQLTNQLEIPEMP